MSGGGIGAFFLMLIVWPIFLLPTIIAVKKNHKYKLPIILIWTSQLLLDTFQPRKIVFFKLNG